MLTLLGTVAAIVAVVLAIAIHVYEHRRSPGCTKGQRIRARPKQRSIAVWRIGRFYQCLQQVDDYCDRIESQELSAANTDPGRPSQSDLLNFAEAALLTAATEIVPFSQGKANLFHFADVPKLHERKIVSQSFSGAFPPSQVLSGTTTYREMSINHDVKASSVAGECVRIKLPHLERITKSSTFSGEELQLGTTHILGIPARLGGAPNGNGAAASDDFCMVPRGLPAAITVDLRIGLTRPLLPLIRRFGYRRSKFISHRLARLSELIATQNEANPATSHTTTSEPREP
jgi:hypothetical protein